MQFVCRDLSAVAGQLEVKKGGRPPGETGSAHEQVIEGWKLYSSKRERVFKVSALIRNYCSA
jgi:hypothetical protein